MNEEIVIKISNEKELNYISKIPGYLVIYNQGNILQTFLNIRHKTIIWQTYKPSSQH